MNPTVPAQDIQAIFNRIAPAYDRLNDQLSLGLHRVWKQMAVKWSQPRPGSVCLDVCCGSGDLARLLSQQVGAEGQVYGLDFSAAQLAIAQQRSQQSSHLRSIQWVEGDALQLPFSNNQFDAATMGYGLRNVTDIPRSLQELHRVLKPGAKVAILDFHRPSHPQFRAFQQWYLDHFVVPLAEGMGLRDEYAYISPSLDRFPVGSQQVDLAYQAGFSQAVHYAIAAGMMGILVATK
ncbi:MAG TPA: bifunctional demethylmenaquinone methyltransferase/2-methoxy-6-polyprenyl-1,4-benzoquinol methylase UbiE [Coleofasciculaceae cyanobacterium]